MKSDKTRIIYRILAIICFSLSAVSAFFALIYPKISDKIEFPKEEDTTSNEAELQGEEMSFYDPIDLGFRSDGTHYSLVSASTKKDGLKFRLVVIKDDGYDSTIDYAMPSHEPIYLVSENLSEEDFSDLMDDSFIEEHKGYFQEREDCVFPVIDYKKDIIKKLNFNSIDYGFVIPIIIVYAILSVLGIADFFSKILFFVLLIIGFIFLFNSL